MEKIIIREYTDDGQFWLPPDKVIDLVRCKDCKHFERYYGDSKKGVCEKLNIIGRPEEWFCADGKRK